MAPEVERVRIVAVERQQPRCAEEHRFDGLRGEPLPQHGPVRHSPGQREVGLLVPAVAQRAEIEPVEGLVPVVGRFGEQRPDASDLAAEPVEEQRREKLGALQRAEPRQVTAAGVCPGSGLQPFDRPLPAAVRHVTTG